MYTSKNNFERYKKSALGAAVGVAMALAPFALNAQVATSTATSNATSTVTSTATTTTNQNTATTTSGATTTPVTIMVMEHLCGSGITNMNDFVSAENNGNMASSSGMGTTTLEMFARAEWACPTTVLPANQPTPNTIAAAPTNFDFKVTDNAGQSKMLSSSMFMQDKVCESDLGIDLNGNGATSTATCLDASSYVFGTTTGNNIAVEETGAPSGHHYGTTLFTPASLDGNNDMQSFVVENLNLSAGTGKIVLSTATDTDRMIMLHVFNFSNATSTGTTTPGTTNTAPTISLTGSSVITLNAGQTFTDPGATATDTESGNLTSSIVVTGGPVNTSTNGVTTLTYTVTDPAGLHASVTRTVIVLAAGGGGSGSGTGSGTGTTTGTSTPLTLSSDTLQVILNIVQRIEDIQAGLINFLNNLIGK